MRRIGLLLALGVMAIGGARAAEDDSAERRTVAYVAFGLEELAEPLGFVDPFADRNPFEDGEVAPAAFIDKLRTWAGAVPESRFLSAGDQLLDLCGPLLKEEFGALGGSWAIYNEATHRVVVHGTRREHGALHFALEAVAENSPCLVDVQVRLLKLRAAEVGAVAWTEEAVRDRLLEEASVAVLMTRPGQLAKLDLQVGGAATHLRIEPNIGADRRMVDLRMEYETALDEEGVARVVRVNVGTTALSGMESFIELGSSDDPERSLVLGVRSVVRFVDGTPCWQWLEHEDPAEQPDLRPKVHEEPEPAGRKLEDGMFLASWLVPPTLLDDLSAPEGEGGDPFGDDVGESAPPHRLPVVAVVPPEIAEEVGHDTLVDLAEVMREYGIEIPAGGWICYARQRSRVHAKMDAVGVDLMDQLIGGGCGLEVKMIRVSASVISWKGEADEDLLPGEIPAGARRLMRAGLVARAGQQATVLLGRESEDGAELLDGLRFQIEPNVGANDQIVDLRFALEGRGHAKLSLSQAVTLHDGMPAVLPLGRIDGKALALVLVTALVDAAGEPYGSGE